jgi:hypothetical protein
VALAQIASLGSLSAQGPSGDFFLCGDRQTDCGTFLVFELEVGVDVLRGIRPHVGLGVGIMKHATPDWTGGVMFNGGGTLSLAAWRVSPRIRWWLSDDVSVEAEAGLLKTFRAGGYDAGWGVTSGARVNWNDRGLLFLRHDVAWARPSLDPQSTLQADPPNAAGRTQRRHALAVGAGAGSDVAGIAIASVGGAALVTLIVYCIATGCPT